MLPWACCNRCQDMGHFAAIAALSPSTISSQMPSDRGLANRHPAAINAAPNPEFGL